MKKHAHITSRPNVQVGDRVLGLCGKDFKMTVLWTDIPKDHPICRECVDIAIVALTQADQRIETARVNQFLAQRSVDRVSKGLNDELELDRITQADDDFAAEQKDKREAKAAKKKAKVTCTCTWTSPEIFTEDPACPIHGGELDAIGVDVPEIEETPDAGE